jgi:hypothetical protein
MRIVHFEKAGVPGIAADDGSGWHGLTERESGFPGTLPELIARGADLLRTGRKSGAGRCDHHRNTRWRWGGAQATCFHARGRCLRSGDREDGCVEQPGPGRVKRGTPAI